MKLPLVCTMTILFSMFSLRAQNSDYIKTLMQAVEERFNAREEAVKTKVDLWNRYHDEVMAVEGAHWTYESNILRQEVTVKYDEHRPRKENHKVQISESEFEKPYFFSESYNGEANDPGDSKKKAEERLKERVDAEVKSIKDSIEAKEAEVFDDSDEDYKSQKRSIPDVAAIAKKKWEDRFEARKMWLETGKETSVPSSNFVVNYETNPDYNDKLDKDRAEWQAEQDIDIANLKKQLSGVNAETFEFVYDSSEEDNATFKSKLAAFRAADKRFDDDIDKLQIDSDNDHSMTEANMANVDNVIGDEAFQRAYEKLEYLKVLEQSIRFNSNDIGYTCGAEFTKATIQWVHEEPNDLQQNIAVLNQIALILNRISDDYLPIPEQASDDLIAQDETVTISPLLIDRTYQIIGLVNEHNYVARIREISDRINQLKWLKWPMLGKAVYGNSTFDRIEGFSSFFNGDPATVRGESNTVKHSLASGDVPSRVARVDFIHYEGADMVSSAPSGWQLAIVSGVENENVIYSDFKHSELIHFSPIDSLSNSDSLLGDLTVEHTFGVEIDIAADYDGATYVDDQHYQTYVQRRYKNGYESLSLIDASTFNYSQDYGFTMDAEADDLIKDLSPFLGNKLSPGSVYIHHQGVCKPNFPELPSFGPLISDPSAYGVGIAEDMSRPNFKGANQGVYFTIPTQRRSTLEPPRIIFDISDSSHLSHADDQSYDPSYKQYEITVNALWSSISIAGSTDGMSVEHELPAFVLNSSRVLDENGNTERTLSANEVIDINYTHSKPIRRITYEGGYMLFTWNSLYNVDIEYFKGGSSVREFNLKLDVDAKDVLYCKINSTRSVAEKYGTLVVSRSDKPLFKYIDCSNFNSTVYGTAWGRDEDNRVEYLDTNGEVEYAYLYSHGVNYMIGLQTKLIELLDGDFNASTFQRSYSTYYRLSDTSYIPYEHNDRLSEVRLYSNPPTTSLYNWDSFGYYNSSANENDLFFYKGSTPIRYSTTFLTGDETKDRAHLPNITQIQSRSNRQASDTNWASDGDVIEFEPNGKIKTYESTTSGIKDELKILTK